MMKHQRIIFAIYVTVVSICDAFTTGDCRSRSVVETSTYLSSSVIEEHTTTKSKFLQSLDIPYDLNKGSKERTKLLNDVIDTEGGLLNPGSQESFASVATGSWRVCYAPHMTFMSGLARGEFSVQYDLTPEGTIISHARYNFPLFNLYGYLSVSGTYGSVNDNVCRVDFDEAWIRTCDNSFKVQPYANIDIVPDSISKTLIRNMGKALFIEAFAVFPVSYLDDNLIVFDFELLGTRICARKKTKT